VCCLADVSLSFLKTMQDVLKATRTQIERELQLEDVTRVEDLPAYSLLMG
jgi:hypothetical protein